MPPSCCAAKSPRVGASLATLLGVLHALPLAYSKDLQEDKEALFDAVDTLETCLEAAERLLAGLRFDRDRLAGAAADEMVAATDIADLLVRKGMPFREAHGVVGGLVRAAIEADKPLSELDREELAGHSELLDDEYYEVLGQGAWLDSKLSTGGTSAARLCRPARGRAPGGRGARSRGAVSGLGADFFDRSVHDVARELIGCELLVDGVGGVIVETESYERDDPACHAYAGLTPRTATLFGPPGRAYVYLSYGIHSLLNAVCEPDGSAAGGADQGAGADRGPQRRCAGAARAPTRASSARVPASSPRRSGSASSTTRSRSTGRRSRFAPGSRGRS